MSATVLIHDVSGMYEPANTQPICGKPHLGLKLRDGSTCGFDVTLFLESDEAARDVGAALILAGSALVRAHSPKPVEVT